MWQISIIIPVINEASALEVLLPYLKVHSQTNAVLEILVADGGSSDESVAIANRLGARVISSGKGRALQMNTAAREAKGNILYFLHADSFPPDGFDTHILEAQRKQPVAGCFRLKFDQGGWFLDVSGWMTRFNVAICRGGDQSLFIPSEWFWHLGGYNESYRIYEDNDLTDRLYRKFPFKVLPFTVVTSARRYREIGTFRLQYYFALIHLKKRLGYTPEALWEQYRNTILK
jgi:rSAM/selenodomain-associated transferase 2